MGTAARLLLACFGAWMLAGCSSGRRAIVQEAEAAGLAPFIMPGKADIGRFFRMRGFLQQGSEEAYVCAALPDGPPTGPNEMRYCFQCSSPAVWRALRRRLKAAPPGSGYTLAGVVDVVVEYLGKSANSDCWLGEVRIVGVIPAATME